MATMFTQDSIQYQLRKIIAENLGIDQPFDDSKNVEALGGDSLDAIEITMEVEEHFRIEISDTELDSIVEQPVSNLSVHVYNKLKAQGRIQA